MTNAKAADAMISTRGFAPYPPPCFINPDLDDAILEAGPGAAGLWGRALTPPDTPTSLSSTSTPFATFVHSSDPTDGGAPPSPPLLRARCAVEPPPPPPPPLTQSPEPECKELAHTASWRLRSRRHRLSTRPIKRPFTPDIKKLLKGWLVRRRDNPYPSRAEKEALATRTGLTYMQVCNWFANWRRKLRDCARPEDGDEDEAESGRSSGEGAGAGAGAGSWAHLIRRYNAIAGAPNSSTAQEHFSISSSDSIWQADGDARSDSGTCLGSTEAQQNAYVSSTTTDRTDAEDRSDVTLSAASPTPCSSPTPRKRRHPSEDADGESAASWPAVLGEAKRSKGKEEELESAGSASGSALLLTKWLESAARYQPSGTAAGAPGWGIASVAVEHALEGRHREELDAAEALAFLSSLHFR